MEPSCLDELLMRLRCADDYEIIFIYRYKEPKKDPRRFARQYGLSSPIMLGIVRSLKKEECIGEGLKSRDEVHKNKKWVFLHRYNSLSGQSVRIYIKISSSFPNSIVVESFHEATKEY